jgi:two-component system nitrogen regulation sensor histidine kinase GlnL
MNVTHASFAGLDLLASAVLLIDDGQLIRYINAAGENLLAVSSRSVVGKTLGSVCTCSATLQAALDNGLHNNWGYTGQNIALRRNDGETLHINCTVTPLRRKSRPACACCSSCSRSSTTWPPPARSA